MKGVFITATDTDVGKTIFTALLGRSLIAKLGSNQVDIWKPVQSGTSLNSPDSDSAKLHKLSGLNGEATDRVGPTYLHALGPEE